ncbi:MAG: peptidylprolyl isomerase [Rubricella sp.]
MRILTGTLLLVALCMAGLAASAQSATPFAPAVIVNDRVITRYDVNQRVGMLEAFGERGELREFAQEQLVEETLMLAEAERLGLALNEEQLAAALEEFAGSAGASAADLTGVLRRAGVDRGTLETRVAAQSLWRIIVQRRFAAQARPTPLEIEDALLAAATEPERELRLSEIAIPVFERGTAGTATLARRLFEELNSGGDFEAAVRQYSRAGSARQNGDIGWIRLSELDPSFRRAVEPLQVGQVSAPVPITRGVTLLKVTDERPVPSTDAGRVTLTVLRADFANAEAATAARPNLDNCGVTRLQGANAIEEEGPFSLGAVDDPLLFETLTSLRPAIPSQPVPRAGVVSLYLLCDRDVSATDEERERIADRLYGARLRALADGLMQDLRRAALIEER